jgi:HSP20 family protein
LREAMNNLLEESFVRPRSGAAAGTSGLAVDVRETGDGFVVTASVPGVRPEDVDITILGETLQIRGEYSDESERQEGQGEQGRWLIRERRSGAFERTISLPASVKADAANAEFRDGLLTVTLPKADEAKPRTIPVRGGSGSGQSQAIDVSAQNGGTSDQ